MSSRVARLFAIVFFLLFVIPSFSQSFYWGYERCGQVLNNIYMLNPSQGYGVGASGQIRYTKDGGTTWTFTTLPWTGVAPVSYYGVWGTSAGNVWITGERGIIRKWNGTTWVDQSLTTAPFNTVTVNAIYGLSNTDAWVVTDKNYSLHYDGSSWSYVPTGLGFTTSLRAVWMASSGNGWAVGDGGNIVHWNGTAWASQPSGTTQTIWEVWGSDATHVWASTTGGNILFYNGSVWSTQLAASGTNDYIKGIWGTGPTDVWALGTVSTGTPAGTHIYHFDGVSWTLQQTLANRFLYKGRSPDPTHEWAVGEGGCIYKGNGTSWVAQKDETTNNGFRCAWSADYNNSWVAGGSGGIMKWDGTLWTQQVAESTGGSDLMGMSGVNSSNIWAVGQNGAILKFDGASWNTQPSGTGGFPLYGVWAADVNNVWAVGANGIILKYNGSTWSPQASGVTKYLLAVWGTDVNNIWAVGESGTILKYNGTSWSQQPSGLATNISLNGVWGTSAGNVLACGSGGKLLKYDGSAWSGITNTFTTQPLNAIWGRDAGKVYITGNGSAILVWNGSSLSMDNSPEVLSAYSIIPRDATDLFAAGSASILTTKTVTTFSVLPLYWGNFTGQLLGSAVALQWNTFNESNNKGFTVQRSRDGAFFTSIGFVAGKNGAANNYTFKDSSGVIDNKVYYRLQETDVDGKQQTSKIIEMHSGISFSNGVSYPNPAHHSFSLNDKDIKDVMLMDASGKRVGFWKVGLPQFTISTLAKGMYWIQWTNKSGDKKTAQLVID